MTKPSPNEKPQKDSDKQAEADRRFESARKRWLAVENNKTLLTELAKR